MNIEPHLDYDAAYPPEPQAGEGLAAATGAHGSYLKRFVGRHWWRCTGCDVTGTWDEWKSAAEPGKHMCDVCLLDGKMSAKLVPLSPNGGAERQSPPPTTL